MSSGFDSSGFTLFRCLSFFLISYLLIMSIHILYITLHHTLNNKKNLNMIITVLNKQTNVYFFNIFK